jgi:hypothetical protein
MSIKVREIADIIEVANPAKPGEVTTMQNVVFIEEGRSGANIGLSTSSDLLSEFIGENVGLIQTRTHTQPVRLDQVAKFQPGMEIPGLHINRELHSVPQMRNQVDKEARMINGKPTYFVTYLSKEALPDKDFRLDIDTLAKFNPSELFDAQVGATITRRADRNGENSRLVGPNEANVAGTRLVSPLDYEQQGQNTQGVVRPTV